jgi:hypothetical protein
VIDRDILLVSFGGLIGLVSSITTIFAIYILEGLRLKRQWEREDRLALRQKRDELKEILDTVRQTQTVDEKTDD